jgi:putrescine importer
MTSSPQEMREDGPRLRRTLPLWDLVFYGIVIIQPVAPMGIHGVVSQEG